MDKQPTPDEIIDALGGTSKVAEMSDVTDSAVSQWRVNGIPKHQLKFLRLARPAVFAALGVGDSVPRRRATDPEPEPGRAGRTPPSRDNLMTFGGAQSAAAKPKA